MRFINVQPGGVVVEIDATDCFALADACRFSLNHDVPGDHELMGALGSALTASAVIAAMDTIRDSAVPEDKWLEDARRVWAPRDSAAPATQRVSMPPA